MMPFEGDRAASRHGLPEAYSGTNGFRAGMVPAEARDGYPPYGQPSASLPPGMAATPDAMMLLKALKRRWFLATLLGVLCAVGASVGIWYTLPLKYTARALIHIASRPPSIAGKAEESSGDFLVYQKTQAALMKSRIVLTSALRQPRIAELSIIREKADPAEWLEKEIKIDFTQSPELARLSLAGDRPQELVAVLNAVIDAYIEEIVNDEQRARLGRLQKLKDEYSKYGEMLRIKRLAYNEAADKIGTGNTAVILDKERFEQERLGAVQKELLELERDMRKAQLELVSLQAKQKAGAQVSVPEASVQEVFSRDRIIEQYHLEMAAHQEKLERDAAVLPEGKNDARLQPTRDRIEAIQQAINTRKENQRPLIIEQARAREQSTVKESLAQAQAKYSLMQELERGLQDEVKRLMDSVKHKGRNGLDILARKDEVDRYDEVAKKLRSEVESANIALDTPPRVTLRDRAEVRQARDEKKQIIMAGLAGTAMLGFVLFGISYWEFRARRIDTVDDVVRGLGWRLVGALPALPSRVRRSGTGNSDWQKLLTESVDATRTTLLHASRTEGLRTVMVTSAVSGEGKTSLSCHLAASLARAGRRTLLIDCDLRRPSAHKLFDLPQGPGFSELLRGEADFPEVIHATPSSSLWMIPAGKCDHHTLQALSQEVVPTILSRLKEEFDFIIIDTSPVLPVVDALQVGQHVDVVIFSLLRDVSRVPNVYAAYQRLSSLGIRMMGAVVNGVHGNKRDYLYQY